MKTSADVTGFPHPFYPKHILVICFRFFYYNIGAYVAWWLCGLEKPQFVVWSWSWAQKLYFSSKNHSHPSNIKVNNMWRRTSTPPLYFHGEYRNKFTVPATARGTFNEFTRSMLSCLLWWKRLFANPRVDEQASKQWKRYMTHKN